MKLKDYTDPFDIATAIRKGEFSYQTVLNFASKLKNNNDKDHILYSDACKEYTKMKKKAISNFLREWSNG